MVTMFENWAIRSLPSKSDKIGHDGASTTERVLVSNDGLINQKKPKIQSTP
jgi:hypothetical protein